MTDSVGAVRWVDNHCHLGEDIAASIAAAQDVGVQKFIDVGCDLATSQACIAHAAEHPEVYATVGLHPHEARHGLDGLEELLASSHVIAVGECGLDYHYNHSPAAAQRSMFAAQINLAHRHGLPLVIHTREAWQETFEILDAEGVPDQTIFHCFTGGPDEAAAGVERGAFLSFSGIVSFKSAADVQEAAKQCPADRLLVETDSPYLAPVPHRGKQNQPAWVSLVGQAVATLRDQPADEIAALTWEKHSSGLPPARRHRRVEALCLGHHQVTRGTRAPPGLNVAVILRIFSSRPIRRCDYWLPLCKVPSKKRSLRSAFFLAPRLSFCCLAS